MTFSFKGTWTSYVEMKITFIAKNNHNEGMDNMDIKATKPLTLIVTLMALFMLPL